MYLDTFTNSTGGLNIPPRLSNIEITILAFLQTHTYLADPIIDIVLLQEMCTDRGLPVAEFCQGFLGLLARRLIEPQGDLRYALSEEGRKHLQHGPLTEYGGVGEKRGGEDDV